MITTLSLQLLTCVSFLVRFGAIQIRNRFWDHHPVLESDFDTTSHAAWQMEWRDGRPTVSGREKIISRPELVDYISVHKVCCEVYTSMR